MGNFQYWGTAEDPDGSWVDVPAYAYHGTYDGNLELSSPEADEFDGTGKPCGAIGLDTIKLNSRMMTGSGMNFWSSFFDASSCTAASIKIKAFDPTAATTGAGAWTSVSGWMLRPRFSRVRVGGQDAALGSTWYYDVDITIVNCELV